MGILAFTQYPSIKGLRSSSCCPLGDDEAEAGALRPLLRTAAERVTAMAAAPALDLNLRL